MHCRGCLAANVAIRIYLLLWIIFLEKFIREISFRICVAILLLVTDDSWIGLNHNEKISHIFYLANTRSPLQTLFRLPHSTLWQSIKFDNNQHSKYSPDGFDFLILLGKTTFGVMTELVVLGGQSLGTLLLSFAALQWYWLYSLSIQLLPFRG